MKCSGEPKERSFWPEVSRNGNAVSTSIPLPLFPSNNFSSHSSLVQISFPFLTRSVNHFYSRDIFLFLPCQIICHFPNKNSHDNNRLISYRVPLNIKAVSSFAQLQLVRPSICVSCKYAPGRHSEHRLYICKQLQPPLPVSYRPSVVQSIAISLLDISKTARANFLYALPVHGRRSVRRRRQCNALRIFGFLDDVVFSHTVVGHSTRTTHNEIVP